MQELTPQKKENRLKRAKELLRLAESDELPNLVFSDEKTFVGQQLVNKHDRVAPSVGSQKSSAGRCDGVAAIRADGCSPLELIDRGIRITSEYILSRKYSGGCIKALGTQTFRPLTLDIPTELSIIALSTQE